MISYRAKRFRSGAGAALLAAGLALGAAADAQSTRNYISIVGSSTVYPFSTVVAERFGRASRFPTPKIESTGSGGGLNLFCSGIGVQHPDITNSSRRIKASELQLCQSNGVDEVIEVNIGYDGIAIASSNSAEPMELTLRQIYLALAKEVPDPAGAERLVANPYRRWSDIDAALPAHEIEVLGPPPTSGTRDAFLELAMEAGCNSFEFVAAMDADTHQTACHMLREDGRYVEAGENDNLIVQKLAANPAAVGIFGFSFLDQNADKVRGLPINGIEPTFDTIAEGDYPISRPLYFYVKKAHVGVIPGMREFMREYLCEAATGEFGYLSDNGLVPLPDGLRRRVAERLEALEPLTLEELGEGS